MFVDSHCHLDRLKLKGETAADVIKRAKERGVEHFLCVAVSVKEYQDMADAMAPFSEVSLSCGVHPLHQEDACSKEALLAHCQKDEVVAVGETGLDYHYSPESKAVQMTSFVDHIQVANEVQKPLIIHTRAAKEDTLTLLREHLGEGTNGVLHCFTEDLDMAMQAIELGFYISISGIVTFHSADELREVAKAIPLDRLLIETDSPWLAPVPHRGKQNEPQYVVDVAQYIADLRNMPLAELAKATTDNFYRLFHRATA